MMRVLRIGTRDSALALWQARTLQSLLNKQDCKSVLVPIKSAGDQNLTQPLYTMGIQGIFTKALDSALLSGQIDVAVHSLKDVPTQLPEGIVLSAVLKRGAVKDIIVYGSANEKSHCIGTGSLRRKAQWLNRYPNDTVEDLRGNVQKRLEKLDQSQWKGALFAKAGLERLQLLQRKHLELDWMIPAPAQGAIGICCKAEAIKIQTLLSGVHCHETKRCVDEERNFLNTLEGGCTAPIGAHAEIFDGKFHFKGGLFSHDGKKALIQSREIPVEEAENFGKIIALEVLENGGKAIMQTLKDQL